MVMEQPDPMLMSSDSLCLMQDPTVSTMPPSS